MPVRGMSQDASSSNQPGWITEKELARHLHISLRHLCNLRKAGLPFIQLGAAVRYSLPEVEAYLRTNRRLASHVERQKRRKALEVQ
jgi:hypothetical protein